MTDLALAIAATLAVGGLVLGVFVFGVEIVSRMIRGEWPFNRGGGK